MGELEEIAIQEQASADLIWLIAYLENRITSHLS